jgi:hypothetical protein
MTADRLQRLLVAGRLAVGGGALVAPRLTGRLFGIDPDRNRAAAYVGRLFGVRAVFMALLLADSAGAERERQLRAGVAVDVTDALAALAAGVRHDLSPAATFATFAAAVAETSLGLRLLSAKAAIPACPTPSSATLSAE